MSILTLDDAEFLKNIAIKKHPEKKDVIDEKFKRGLKHLHSNKAELKLHIDPNVVARSYKN